MRFVTVLMGFVFCVASFEAFCQPVTRENRPDELAQAIPPPSVTYEIHVDVNNDGSSGPYVVIRPSGQLFFVPFRSAKEQFPAGTRSTEQGVVDYSAWHAKLARLVTLEEPIRGGIAGGRKVFFMNSTTFSGRGVYLDDAHTAILRPLFEPFLKPSNTPP